MKTETPRTDAEARGRWEETMLCSQAVWDKISVSHTVTTEFARQLETELTTAQERIRALEGALNSIVTRKSFDSHEAAVEWMERILERDLTGGKEAL